MQGRQWRWSGFAVLVVGLALVFALGLVAWLGTRSGRTGELREVTAAEARVGEPRGWVDAPELTLWLERLP